MDVAKLARGLALNRISFGAGLVAAPGLYARSWVGSAAAEDTTKLLARALGARDLVLGLGGLLALRDGDRERARRWFAAQGATDAIDLLATVAARDVPLPARIFAATAAAGSTAIAAAYVAAVTRQPGNARAIALGPGELEFSAAYVEDDESARWESAAGHSPSVGARASGSSVIRVAPGCRLPRHTDSAEETIVVVAGTAEVDVGAERSRIPGGGLAVVPKDVPHEVSNASDDTLTFVAVYAEPDVVTRYEQVVQPDGGRERHTVE